MRILRLSWKEIEEACGIICKRILFDDFRPELCVAISRGGFVPARLLCDLLDVSNLACLRIEHYSGINERLTEPRMTSPLNADARNKRVLIVDDVADQGDTLALAKKHVQDAGAAETKVATLHYKPWSKIKPDYYAHMYRSWIVYPWEAFEATRKISSKLLQSGKNVDEIEKQLSKINITKKEYRMATRKPPSLLQQQ